MIVIVHLQKLGIIIVWSFTVQTKSTLTVTKIVVPKKGPLLWNLLEHG